MEKAIMNPWQPDPFLHSGPPDTPREPMEFLSRSWSLSAFEISKALVPPPPPPPDAAFPTSSGGGATAAEDHFSSHDQVEAAENNNAAGFSGNPFSFASSETSQMVMARIMSQSREVSPRTSGRLSHSSGPLTDSPPESPSEIIDQLKLMQLSRANNIHHHLGNHFQFPAAGSAATLAGAGGGRTVGRWLKDRKEKRREETRAQNAQLHAAMSVAGVAASVAAIAAATAASSGGKEDEQRAKTDMAVASAAALVAAQCVEAAESMGVDREMLASVLASAVRVRSPGDIVTLTAGAATALRGAATLKARALKEVWNIAAVIPSTSSSLSVDHEKGGGGGGGGNSYSSTTSSSSNSNSGELQLPEEHNFLGICSKELLARGSELLKRTRKGDLHWKIVSVYINKLNQVMLKMKSRHVGGTITKKKKNIVLEVVRDMPSWAGRHLLEGGEHRRYFGLKTVARGLVEFECKNQREYDIWTQGVSRLLSIAAERKRNHNRL